jgi:hypothetical protein
MSQENSGELLNDPDCRQPQPIDCFTGDLNTVPSKTAQAFFVVMSSAVGTFLILAGIART